MADAKRDNNQVTTLIAVSNVDGVTPVVLYADPTTHRLLVSLSIAFTELTDAPSSYTGQAGKAVVVNGTEDGLAFAAIPTNPLTTLGDIIYGGASGVQTRLAGNTTATKKFLTQTGNGSASAAPGWNTLEAGDIPDISATYVPKSLYDAYTVIYADTDNTPAALIVAEQTVVGRKTGTGITTFAIDSDISGVSASHDTIPSALAVKTYVDGIIAAANAMVYKGVIDCSGNPNYPAADAGHTYVVSVAGKIGGASGVNVEVGDLILCNTDGTSAGDQATVGAYWNIIQKNIDGAVTGPASSTSANIVTFNGATGKIIQDSGVAISTDGAMTTNADTKVPTEKAVKTYADLKLAKASNLSDVANAATAFGNIKQAATESATGVAELATTAEINSGNDAGRVMCPDQFAASNFGTKNISIQVIDGATALATGDGKAYLRIPVEINGTNVVGVAASVIVKSTSGAPTVMITRGRQANATSDFTYVDMLSTALTVDANEYDSKDATTAAVIDANNDDLATGDVIRIDVDGAGTGTKGLQVTISCRLP